MRTLFTDQELEHVIDQGMIYMCACPAQVAAAMQQLRGLHDYQQRCLQSVSNDHRVHQAIAQSTLEAHQLLQNCLSKVIELENWDRETLTMPEGLRQRQRKEVESED